MEWTSELFYIYDISSHICMCHNQIDNTYGAIQKLCNGKRRERVDDFVTYRYLYFEGGGGILWNSYVTTDSRIENSKSSIEHR